MSNTRAYFTFFGLLLAISVGFLVINTVINNTESALNVVSVDNIKNLSKQANQSWEALDAKRSTIRTQQSDLETYKELYGDDYATWPQGKRNEYQQLQKIVSSLITSYNVQCAEYNALWQDEWRNLPAPDDLPTYCEMW